MYGYFSYLNSPAFGGAVFLCPIVWEFFDKYLNRNFYFSFKLIVMKGFVIVFLLMLFGTVIHEKFEKQDLAKDNCSVVYADAGDVSCDVIGTADVAAVDSVNTAVEPECGIVATDGFDFTKYYARKKSYTLCDKKYDPGRWV